MNLSNLKIKNVKSLIDEYFSLQWCRDNLVVPTSLEPSLPPSQSVITIAVANIIFLGTIGQTIKERLRNSNFQCKFIEISADEIIKPSFANKANACAILTLGIRKFQFFC